MRSESVYSMPRFFGSSPQARNRRREHLLAERNDLTSVVEDNPELEFVSDGIGQFAQWDKSGAGSGHGGAMLRPIWNARPARPAKARPRTTSGSWERYRCLNQN